MEKINKIIIVDDHEIFRNGFKLLLEGIENVIVTGEAGHGKEFLRLIDFQDADIVFMDISMPGMYGMETTKKAILKKPELKIIALTTFGDEEYFNKMLDAGAKGFLLKNAEPEEFKQAIEMVSAGNHYFSKNILLELSKKMVLQKHTKNKQTHITEQLTNREKEILEFICQGLSSQEIAKKLYISIRTVEGHRARLLSKTGTRNSISLVVHAIKNKLVEV